MMLPTSTTRRLPPASAGPAVAARLTTVRPPRFAALLTALLVAPAAQAQLMLKPDDVWRYAVTAGATSASGNSDSLALNLSLDVGIQNERRRWILAGRGNYGRNDGETSTSTASLGNQWNHELGNQWFAFGAADWFRDRLANLSWRASLTTGPGYHLVKHEDRFWDVFAGVGYVRENYAAATVVADEVRTRYGYPVALVGTESQVRLSESATWKQRLVFYPNLRENGEYRITLDTGLSVAMTRQLALTLTLTAQRNSDPGTGIRKNDILVVSGVTWRAP